MIPKFIYKTASDFDSIHKEILLDINRLKIINSNWNFRLYTDNDIDIYFKKNLDKNNYNLVNMINPKYRVVWADLFRYMLLYNQGGVYIDLKSTIVRTLR